MAQEESLFDDKDLADIEGGAEPAEETDSFKEGDNFDEEDFEVVDEEGESAGDEDSEEAESEDSEEAQFDVGDYEIISDRPDYEVSSDEELEREFKEDSAEGQKDSAGEDLDAEFDAELEEEAEFEEVEGLDESPEEELETEEGLAEEAIEGGELEEIPSEELAGEDSALEEDVAVENGEDSGALNLITNIRYLANEDQIVIDCSEPTSYQVRNNEETHQFIIEILQAKLADNLHWPYVLRDFNTDFGLIKADQKDSSTVRVIIQIKEGGTFPQSVLSESGNQILVAYGAVEGHQIIPEAGGHSADPRSALPARTLEDLYFGDIQFSGAPISFHVIDAPIKQVLRFISEESGLNMVIGEKVSGSITLKLEDVPWDQALHTIFKVKSLGYTRDGNVITILPLEEIEKRAKKLKEISERQKGMAPFETKVISVNYAKIGAVADKIKEFATPKSDFSKGGRIITHPESNTFVIIDSAEAIKKIEAMVKHLDKPPKQVMVEAKIVEVIENFAKNFGLQWGLSGDIPVVHNLNDFIEVVRNPESLSGAWGTNYDGGQSDAALSIAGLPILGNISASLSLAENDGYAKVISNPKLIVISGKQASISRDSPILIPKSATTTISTGGDRSDSQSFEKQEVSISLDVTPTVTPTGSIFLKVNVNRADPGAKSPKAGDTVSVTKNAKTEVLVKNGQTIVIGGIYDQNKIVNNQGLPWLRHIPFLNLLFNTKGTSEVRNELLVFITPKLLDSHE